MVGPVGRCLGAPVSWNMEANVPPAIRGQFLRESLIRSLAMCHLLNGKSPRVADDAFIAPSDLVASQSSKARQRGRALLRAT